MPSDKNKVYIESHEFPEKIEPYAKNLCGRFDTNISVKKKNFLLNKPTVPHKSSIIKALSISLAESVMLQHSQDEKLKVKYTIVIYTLHILLINKYYISTFSRY